MKEYFSTHWLLIIFFASLILYSLNYMILCIVIYFDPNFINELISFWFVGPFLLFLLCVLFNSTISMKAIWELKNKSNFSNKI